MKHLLLTRLQGALIGANTIYSDRQQISPNQLMLDTNLALMDGMSSLTRHGKYELQDWTENIFTDIPNPERAMVAMLPLMLFFHDDRVKLREILVNVSHSWQLDWETCSSAVAIGYIISRSLTESLNSRTIAQLLDEMPNLHPRIFQELSTIERSSDRTSLHQVAQRLAIDSHPMITQTVLAIYCFLSTPEDFSLATRRAYHSQSQSQLTCALTGILAGAHNSLTGIPLNGYIATQHKEQWLSAAENLLAAWAGVYHALASTNFAYPLAVASPRVMQRRD
jgi:hypothetical protein